MRLPNVTLVLCLSGLCGVAVCDPARGEDGITVESMRIEGTLRKLEQTVFWHEPVATLGGRVAGADYGVEVVRGKKRAIAYIGVGDDQQLKRQCEKLIGCRVVVECRGEYELLIRPINLDEGGSPSKEGVLQLTLTVKIIEAAK